MSKRVVLQPNSPSVWPERYTPEMLCRIGVQVEALMSRHSSLEMYKRSIEWQLAVIAAQIREDDVLLLPRTVFLLLEIRGIGGVGAPLEQIAHALAEAGYWKPAAHVQNYHPQDVYHLGESAQRLFDDYAVLDGRVEQLQVQLDSIKQRWHPESGGPPEEVFSDLATNADRAKVRAEVDAVVKLLKHTTRARQV